MRNKLALLVLYVILIPLSLFSLSLNIRSFDHPGYTRIVIEGDRGFEFNVGKSKTGLEVRLKEKAQVGNAITAFKRSSMVKNVVHRVEADHSILKVQLKSPFKVSRNFVLERPFRVVFDLVKSREKEADPEPVTAPPAQDKPEDQPDNQPEDQSPVPEQRDDAPEEPVAVFKQRAAIETICIDAGHGGTDQGAVGSSKVAEKEITLKIGKKLRQLIMSRMGLHVVMTRDTDTEVSLNSRVSIANNHKSQIFVSIHVNSSYRKTARGSETFYVSLKATDQEAFQLSQKENKVFEELKDVGEDDELKMILWDMAQNEYIKESSKLAEFIQDELNVLLSTRNRGVKQAPFRVLMRAAMPAVLVEVAFLSNSHEQNKLQDDSFQDNVARVIYTGISRYIDYHNRVYR